MKPIYFIGFFLIFYIHSKQSHKEALTNPSPLRKNGKAYDEIF